MAELKFSNSCRTFALKQENLFISAFPGSVVFGEVCPTGFIQQKFFKFLHFQYFELYLAIVSIIKFQVSENTTEKGIILQKSEEELYYWTGTTVQINRRDCKILKLFIEFQFETIFEIVLTSEQLNNLIGSISQLILPSLCLNNIEVQIFEFASEQSISFLVTLNNYKNCEKFIKTFESVKELNIDSILQSNFVYNLIYYNEIIILYHKFQSIYNLELESTNRIMTIIEK